MGYQQVIQMCTSAAIHSLPQAIAGLQSVTRDSQHSGEAEEQGKMTFRGFLSYDDIL